MFRKNAFRPFVVFETPNDGGRAPAATATPQPQPTAPARAQVGGQGPRQGQAAAPRQQAQPQSGQGSDGFWGNFPNVPEEHKALLEPHLRQVQAYVTQQQQKFAPFKDYTPQQVQGLARFARDFEANPLGMFMSLAQQLQKDGVIHPELDLEALQAYAQGQFDDDDDPVAPTDGEIPQWAQPLFEKLSAFEQQQVQQQMAQQQAQEDALLNSQIAKVRENLKAAGISEEAVSDQAIVAQIIVANGDVAAAEKSIQDLRTGLLGEFVGKEQPEDDNERQLEMPRGVPKTPKRGGGMTRRGSTRDAFDGANSKAEQFLRSSIAATAQE